MNGCQKESICIEIGASCNSEDVDHYDLVFRKFLLDSAHVLKDDCDILIVSFPFG